MTLRPRRARAPREQRAIGHVPSRRWAAMKLVATLSLQGMGPAIQFRGALDRDALGTYVEQILVPALRLGQSDVLDNPSVHRRAHPAPD